MEMQSESDEDARPGRGKILQRHKREIKALQEQKKIEAGRLMSFAKAKREHKKIEARQEKRDLDEKYKAMEDELKLKHADELAAFQPEESCEIVDDHIGYLEVDGEGRARKPLYSREMVSENEILAAVRSGAMPSVMPARAGSALSARPQHGGGGGFTLPARSLYDSGYRGQHFGPSGEDCPPARPEILERAKEDARIAEEQGKMALKKGPVPTGPPGLPLGVVVIEQRYVDFLLGPGGQSLAAINHAAGVNVILDQTHKFSGYSIANIYGSEELGESKND
ncbi:KH_dom_type_1 domain-containing protein [Durusdinium trenchii]|uniref:KH_dom_type_1 domain-containing protein n=1 Tax=Durusdinium trenchii TaxID=1381693 RepID=A0ABP0Q591_9DINO